MIGAAHGASKFIPSKVVTPLRNLSRQWYATRTEDAALVHADEVDAVPGIGRTQG
jgi:hypothetical protein